MSDLDIFVRLLLAIGFGAILGLETETRATAEEQEAENPPADKPLDKAIGKPQTDDVIHNFRLGGVRTYTLLSLFGALGGLLYASQQYVFGYLIFAAVILLIIAAYVLNVWYRKAFGITTEIAILIATIIGFMSTSQLVSIQILTVIVVVLTFVLSQKRGIGALVSKIAHEELIDIFKFTIVALVVLPFLPNMDVLFGDLPFVQTLMKDGHVSRQIADVVILNPFRLWQYVVLISGFSLLGYFASRALGKTRGLLLTGILGGLISSTSVILSMAGRSKNEADDSTNRSLAGSALVAHAVSFVSSSVLALSVSFVFLTQILPVSLAMSLVALLVGVFLLLRVPATIDSQVIVVKHEPFSLNLALKFALFLTLLRLIVQLANIYLPDSAFVVVTALSGFAGIDVPTIALAELVADSNINVNLAVITFIAVNIVNFAAKSLYAYWQGSKRFAQGIMFGMVLSIIATGIVIFAMMV